MHKTCRTKKLTKLQKKTYQWASMLISTVVMMWQHGVGVEGRPRRCWRCWWVGSGVEVLNEVTVGIDQPEKSRDRSLKRTYKKVELVSTCLSTCNLS
jgi:hypothetical protein